MSVGIRLCLLAVVPLLAGHASAQTLGITTASLPDGFVGVEYTATMNATGGSPPYAWAASGAIPPGVTLNPNGTFSGAPTEIGSFELTVTVTDSASVTSSRPFTLGVGVLPLAVITEPPLFEGTVGLPYVQSFAAEGGVPPYRWQIRAGSTGGLTLDPSTGVLQGTPENAGTFQLTIEVLDSVDERAMRNYSLTVNAPSMTITSGSPLPNGRVGEAYAFTFSAVGGTPPYTWTLTSGTVPGLQFDGGQGVLSGTPTTPGSFTISLEAADSGGLTATKSFAITISPAGLSIDSPRQLPGATLGTEYAFQLEASGGVLPYTWSANGLPEGLTLDANSGLISGTPMAAGAFSFTVRVIDNDRATVLDLFQISVGLPPVPTVSFTGLPATAGPAEQFALQISLSSPYAVAISGQAIIGFAPDVGGGDDTIRFANGETTADFTIPEGTTEAVASPPLAIQTGTVAGTITVSLRLNAGGLDITPSPEPAMSTRIERAAPVINSARVIREASGFTIEVIAHSTAREVTQATYRFTASGGQSLQVSEVTVPMETPFSAWFQDPANSAYGSEFLLRQPFTIQGDANAVIPQTVTLTNRIGAVTANVTQ